MGLTNILDHGATFVRTLQEAEEVIALLAGETADTGRE
jgi:ATP-dependent protease HslVU (ClpYQ) peptidase subunit